MSSLRRRVSLGGAARADGNQLFDVNNLSNRPSLPVCGSELEGGGEFPHEPSVAEYYWLSQVQ